MHENCEGSVSSTPKNCGSGEYNKIKKTKLACILEADESTRLRMGNLLHNHHKDHISGKRRQFITALQFGSQIFPMPQAMKIPCRKLSGGQGMGKTGEISAWNLTRVRSKKQVIDEARTSGVKVHFASLMDMCHLKNAAMEAKHQKYKGRVVLRGDIVKEDSGSYLRSIH